MASGQADTPGGKNWMVIVAPAVGVALLVGALVASSVLSEQPDKGGKGDKGGVVSQPTAVRARRSPLPVNPDKLADGTAPGDPDPGLIDLGGGLKYRDLKVGDGEECPVGAHPIMDFTGWLTNGSRFDSSFKPGGKALDQYALHELVKGWQQGVPGMKVGGIRKLVVPPDMGYGDSARPGIPANSTLVFEMELLGLK